MTAAFLVAVTCFLVALFLSPPKDDSIQHVKTLFMCFFVASFACGWIAILTINRMKRGSNLGAKVNGS